MKQSPIFAKTYDMLLWLFQATTKFPREHRFVMARFVQEAAIRFQDDLLEAGLGHGKTRQRALAKADVHLAKLRFYIRLSRDLGLFTPRQYRHVAEMVAEIGRLLGGWRTSLGQPPPR